MANLPLKALDAGCVIFDLDGTLVDTAPDLLATLNVLMADLGRRPLDLSEIREAIGHGARSMISNGAKMTGTAISDQQIEQLFHHYLAHYSRNIANKSAPFPGAIEVLETLSRRNISLAICTNKLENLSRQLLDALKILSYFDVIIGLDTLKKAKPDPLPVFEILRKTSARAEKTLFIGDSETDVKTARAAGVSVVVVDYGYSAKPVNELGADAIISDLRDLL